ncbi:DUF5675 family protein [Limnobacter parvus]|uniref:DUF5675 family protein n=1 Tax=Limnobacter parvus TaxID=2939690 RepID=A0ABT1XG98_9BURK|nr:DUF5675 family protein [Limnobacter parvus]MCR2746300.1 DUF5675 family protein [Limnobacter parvus]
MTESYVIHVNRRWQTEESTISDFSVENTDLKGYILEEKGPSSAQAGMQLRIPAGEYNLVWHHGGRFGPKVPKLFNFQVSPGRLILIHPGNDASDTEGCLIVGHSRKINRVESSKLKFGQLMKLLEPTDLSKSKLIITEDFQ